MLPIARQVRGWCAGFAQVNAHSNGLKLSEANLKTVSKNVSGSVRSSSDSVSLGSLAKLGIF